MKRILKAILASLVLCLALAACGGGGGSAAEPVDYKADFVGTWEISKMVQDGEETSTEDLDLMKQYGLNVYLELNEDGTSSLELFGEPMEGTWEATAAGNGTITIDGQSVSMVLDGNLLTLEQEGSTLSFVQIDPSEKVDGSGAGLDALTNSGEGTAYYGGDTIEDLDGAVELNINLVDDDVCTIKLVGMGDYVGDPGYLFELTNKTGADVLFMSTGDWTASGIVDDPVLYETVRAGETLGSIMWFNADTVGDDVTALSNISGQIVLLDSLDTSNEIATYDIAF